MDSREFLRSRVRGILGLSSARSPGIPSARDLGTLECANSWESRDPRGAQNFDPILRIILKIYSEKVFNFSKYFYPPFWLDFENNVLKYYENECHFENTFSLTICQDFENKVQTDFENASIFSNYFQNSENFPTHKIFKILWKWKWNKF